MHTIYIFTLYTISRVNSTRHSPPSKPRSRVNSQPSPAKPKSPLPPDAVDLVVEAAPSPTSPTSPSPIGRTPLKRVYRRGIVGPEGEHAEVQVNTSSPREGEEVLSAIEDEGSIVEELIEREEEAEEEGAGVKDAEIVMGVDAQGEGAVVRTTTPPAHVYGIDEGNPWS
ncbi:hypothetical protein VNI00_008808 [Paramarasmius palmivorus]|uniref:Uncharacterized protein n=1 Tax=Paramarasmius palmivorus TaxID=297713 RepID=A0AAW0CWT8_9AGAR